MSGRTVIAIGVFDGVHLGHRKILQEAVRLAGKVGAKTVAATFNPHPLSVISQKAVPMSLISLEHRMRLIRAAGVDKITIFNFTKEFSKIPAERFVKDALIKKLNAGWVVVGEDFCFGRRRQGDAGFLKQQGKKYGLLVKLIKPLKYKGRLISSSLIRQAIRQGRLDLAERLLGRPVGILGNVVKGKSLGATIGFPTANINPHHEIVPPSGVYAVTVRIDGKEYGGVLNIGIRPTFYGSGKRDEEPTIEVHIFGFAKKVYGKVAEVLFTKRLRAEKRFQDKDALAAQIKDDAENAKKNIKLKIEEGVCRRV